MSETRLNLNIWSHLNSTSFLNVLTWEDWKNKKLQGFLGLGKVPSKFKLGKRPKKSHGDTFIFTYAQAKTHVNVRKQ